MLIQINPLTVDQLGAGVADPDIRVQRPQIVKELRWGRARKRQADDQPELAPKCLIIGDLMQGKGCPLPFRLPPHSG